MIYDKGIQIKAGLIEKYAIGSEDDGDNLFVSPPQYRTGQEFPDPGDDAELRDVRASNPWTIAKVNAPIRRNATTVAQAILPTPARQSGDMTDRSSSPSLRLDRDAPALPSPGRTQTEASSTENLSSSPERFPYPLTARKPRSGHQTARAKSPVDSSNRERYSHGALDTWVQRSSPTSTGNDQTPVLS